MWRNCLALMGGLALLAGCSPAAPTVQAADKTQTKSEDESTEDLKPVKKTDAEWRWQRAVRLLVSIGGIGQREAIDGDDSGVCARFDRPPGGEADDRAADRTAPGVCTTAATAVDS